MKLSRDTKIQHRQAISGLQLLHDSLETALSRGEALPSQQAMMLSKLAQTDELEGQFECIEALLDQTRAAYMEMLRLDAPHSLASFAEYLRPEEPPARHHEWLCEKLEAVDRREIMRLLVSMPPGHAKSTYCSHLFPVWYLGRHPNHKYLQAGHTQDFVEKEFGLRTRQIVESQEYGEIFPEVRLSTASKAAGAWSISGKLGRYVGKGVGQGISGYRGNIGGVDDPYPSRKEAESQAKRKEVYDWFMADFTTRLLPKSPLFIVATRWHPLDLCGVLEDNTRKGIGQPWDVINLPAIAEDENDPLGRAQGDALWPEFFDIAHLLDLKATLPPRDWNSLYRGKPVDENGGVLIRDWIGRYEVLPTERQSISKDEKNPLVRRVTVSVDCANKDTERSDYTAITVWVEDQNGAHYLAQVIRQRMNFEPMIEAINSAASKWNADAILVEDKGSGTQYIQTQSGKAPAPVIPVSVSNDSKQFRFDAVTPMFQAGEVLLPERAAWLADYEAELLSFPGGAHDDMVDSTSQYLAWARKGRKLGVKKAQMGSAQSTVVDDPGAQSAAPGTTSIARADVDRSWMHVQKHVAQRHVRRMGSFERAVELTTTSTPSAPISG